MRKARKYKYCNVDCETVGNPQSGTVLHKSYSMLKLYTGKQMNTK
jgi:hypothetical protein